MHRNIVDLGIPAGTLEDYLRARGYWSTAERRQRHFYILSPCAYVLHTEQRNQLDMLARAAYAAVTKLEREIFTLATKKKLSHPEAEFLRIARSAAHGLLTPGEDATASVPEIIKIDIVVSSEGHPQAVEIDVHNPRALGTTILVDGTLPLAQQAPAYPMGRNLGQMLAMRTRARDPTWKIIVAEGERYYSTSFEVLASFLRAEGVSVEVLMADALAEDPRRIEDEELIHVFAISERMDRNPKVRERLIARVRAGTAQCFYPPKAYLGTKAFMPHLARQEGMNGFIPATALLSGRGMSRALFSRPPTTNLMVVKYTNGSGAKGIVLSEADPERYQSTIQEGMRCNTPQWILQEQVPQEPQAVTVFDEKGKREVHPYYFRITLAAAECGIVGLKVTGRQDQVVHGAPDCIQLPVIMGH